MAAGGGGCGADGGVVLLLNIAEYISCINQRHFPRKPAGCQRLLWPGHGDIRISIKRSGACLSGWKPVKDSYLNMIQKAKLPVHPWLYAIMFECMYVRVKKTYAPIKILQSV